MKPEYALRIAHFFVGNSDVSQDEGVSKAEEIIKPLTDDSARLQWLSENLDSFFNSKFHVLAQFDGLRAAIDAAKSERSAL